MSKISCIVPAFNESARIGAVLKAVSEASDCISEILVVDDGSSDGTAQVVATFPNVRLLINQHNMGKSQTVARGIRESTGDYVFFLDADLAGINADNIRDLARPILTGQSDIVISMRANTPGWMKKVGLDFMSGERIFPKDILMAHIDELSRLRNFALEVFLNRVIIANQFKIKSVPMANVKNVTKWGKGGLLNGIWREFKLWLNVFSFVSPVEFVTQNIKLKKLLV